MEENTNKVIVLYPTINSCGFDRYSFEFMSSSEIVSELKKIKDVLHTSGNFPFDEDELNDFDDSATEVLFDGDETKTVSAEIEIRYAFGLSPDDSIKNYWAVSVDRGSLENFI